jgi:hypothetical protein
MEAARRIKKSRPELKVLMLTMHKENEYLRQAREIGSKASCSRKTWIWRYLAPLPRFAGVKHLSPPWSVTEPAALSLPRASLALL